ncbi:MAG: DUF2155 domain-containing protein [Hyphomicrobiaceae bacterium]
MLPKTMTLATLARATAVACAALALGGVWVASASADRIPNKVAVFAALDKVTARISRLEVELDQTVQFGALTVTPRTCFTRPPTEPPKTTAFVEVQEIKLDGNQQPIFRGWMFAQSPGLHAVEHPVFDIWLTDCQGGDEVAATASNQDGEQPVKKKKKKRRVKRQ